MSSFGPGVLQEASRSPSDHSEAKRIISSTQHQKVGNAEKSTRIHLNVDGLSSTRRGKNESSSVRREEYESIKEGLRRTFGMTDEEIHDILIASYPEFVDEDPLKTPRQPLKALQLHPNRPTVTSNRKLSPLFCDDENTSPSRNQTTLSSGVDTDNSINTSNRKRPPTDELPRFSPDDNASPFRDQNQSSNGLDLNSSTKQSEHFSSSAFRRPAGLQDCEDIELLKGHGREDSFLATLIGHPYDSPQRATNLPRSGVKTSKPHGFLADSVSGSSEIQEEDMPSEDFQSDRAAKKIPDKALRSDSSQRVENEEVDGASTARRQKYDIFRDQLRRYLPQATEGKVKKILRHSFPDIVGEPKERATVLVDRIASIETEAALAPRLRVQLANAEAEAAKVPRMHETINNQQQQIVALQNELAQSKRKAVESKAAANSLCKRIRLLEEENIALHEVNTALDKSHDAAWAGLERVQEQLGSTGNGVRSGEAATTERERVPN